jgi:hypothetical protein
MKIETSLGNLYTRNSSSSLSVLLLMWKTRGGSGKEGVGNGKNCGCQGLVLITSMGEEGGIRLPLGCM